MKNRLISRINEALRKKEKLFCAYLTLGYPSVSYTEDLVRYLAEDGADIIELGFPFSDPLADGPTIQFSSEYALRHRVKLHEAFSVVRRLRKRKVNVPILFFSYYNPLYQWESKHLARRLKESGFDGAIIPDLSPDESSDLPKELAKQGLSLVYLIAPTSSNDRIRMISRKSSGFVYFVSLKGVTGMRKKLDESIALHVRRIRRASRKAVLVGFGVSNPKQVRKISRISDGVIVGSAFIEAIRRSGKKISSVRGFARSMIQAAKGKR